MESRELQELDSAAEQQDKPIDDNRSDIRFDDPAVRFRIGEFIAKAAMKMGLRRRRDG